MSEDIAELMAEQRVLINDVGRMLRLLDGNGQPGLVIRVTALESSMVALLKELADIRKENGEVLSVVRKHIENAGEIEESIDTLQDDLALHLRPDNPQHQTLRKLWNEKPWQLILTVIILFVILTVLYESNVIEKILSYLAQLI